MKPKRVLKYSPMEEGDKRFIPYCDYQHHRGIIKYQLHHRGIIKYQFYPTCKKRECRHLIRLSLVNRL